MRHLVAAFVVLLGVIFVIVAVPLFSVHEGEIELHDMHGGHLWSSRLDVAVWYKVTACLVGFVLSMLTTLISFLVIFIKVQY
jgi:hypothetical protein